MSTSETKTSAFPSKEEEVSRLLDEIKALRDELRDLNAKVSRIERRVQHAFPILAAQKAKDRSRRTRDDEAGPTITPAEAISFFERLVEMTNSGQESQVLAELDTTSEPNLRLTVQELGVSLGKKKASRKILVESIVKRIKESVMLSRHVNRERAQTTVTDTADPKGEPGIKIPRTEGYGESNTEEPDQD